MVLIHFISPGGTREETPPELQYLIKDLFEDITLFSNRTLEASAVKRADGKYEVTIRVEARKFKAGPHGNETEVPVDDWIDIGAFAKPPDGTKYGNTLYRERVHITQRDSILGFITAQLPDQAGIDPFAFMIDRDPNDNMKSVTLQSGGLPLRTSHVFLPSSSCNADAVMKYFLRWNLGHMLHTTV